MASAKKTVLITGSTRGIGLGFAESYVKAGWNVIGTAHTNSNTEKLKALAPFKIIAMDTSDEASILEAARQLEGQSIDLLINNAGIALPSALQTCTKDTLMRQFEVNAVGPFLVSRALLPNLQLAAKTNGGAFVVQLSSALGSIGSFTKDTENFFKLTAYGYASSKTALNMITRSLAFELQPSGIVVVSVHPGYVDTYMTRGKASLKPEDRVPFPTGSSYIEEESSSEEDDEAVDVDSDDDNEGVPGTSSEEDAAATNLGADVISNDSDDECDTEADQPRAAQTIVV